MSRPAFPGHLDREDPDLTDRQRRVLATLVSLHGRSARPVVWHRKLLDTFVRQINCIGVDAQPSFSF